VHLKACGEARSAVGPNPAGQDGIEAFDDESDMAWIDRPGPSQGLGHVVTVDHRFAQQDAQGDVGPYPLATVEPEGGHLVAVALDLRAQRSQVLAQPRDQLPRTRRAQPRSACR